MYKNISFTVIYMYILSLYPEIVCGEGRIPYSKLDKMKAVIVGLPAGVSFKQPSLYKQSELRLIHQQLEKIQFVPISDPEPEASESVEISVHVSDTSCM